MARSVTIETKAKFEALLKAALRKTDSKSTQNLVEHPQDIGEYNEALETELPLDNNQESNTTNYILDTFLKKNEGVDGNRPIPKVRKKLLQQKSSDSEISNRTFTIENAEKSSSSNSSQRTYNINVEEIGDILVHDQKEIVQILKVNTNRCESSLSKTENEEFELREFTKKEVLSEAEKSDKGDEKTEIVYEDEVKKKAKVTKKKINKEVQSEKIDDQIVSVTIHRTDRLKINKFVIYPRIKIHIINYETGEYLKKSEPQSVVNSEDESIHYLMPVTTRNLNFELKRQFYPEWEETIIINENYQFLIAESTKTMLFFELIDFGDFNESNDSYNIAWAFLKIVAGDGSTNTNKKLRLQLYKPGQSKNGSFCPVFDWWQQKRIKYPSSLYITVKGIISPKKVMETFRSKARLEKEVFKEEEIKVKEIDRLAQVEKVKVEEVLANLQDKTFRLPNKVHKELSSGTEGCFTLKFGNSGKYLACAILSKDVYVLVVYLLPDFEEFFKLSAHQELIYNIAFSKDDNFIIASSADGTVSIWDLTKVKFLQMLPHPSFVYWSEISNDLIATGCYDKILRIWHLKEDKTWELFEELDGHKGYVTCLCINANASRIYSSDSKGVLISWKKNNNWHLYKTIELAELKNTIINQIVLHKKDKRLIVHARDNTMRVLDIKNECVLHWLEGGVNNRVRTTCCLSPCNTYVFCGSESGNINVWNIETGKITAVYDTYTKLSANKLPVHSVDVCPKSKMLALSHFGNKIPIIVYSFDRITSDVDMKTFDLQRKWRDKVQNIREDRRKKPVLISEDEKKVDLKEILDKIDRIII